MRGKPGSRGQTSSDDIPPAADSARISQQDVDKWAQMDANNDNAGIGFQSFDARVEQIVTNCTKPVKEFSNNFKKWTDQLGKDFTEVSGRIPNNPEVYTRGLEIDTLAEIAKATAEYQPKITGLQREYLLWEKRFGAALVNGITNVKSHNRVWHWGLILFLLAVEAVLNSRFFAETSEYGMLGGTLAAVSVSAVNVGLPILFGFFAHLLFYSKVWMQSMCGLLLCMGFVGFAGSFNYAVAEYRDHLLLQAGKETTALEYFSLLSIGCAIAIISFWKIYSYLDPFSRPRRCHENILNASQDFQSSALRPLDTARRDINETQRNIKNKMSEAERRLENERVDFEHTQATAIQEADRIAKAYHLAYCPAKIDPDPSRPEVNTEKYGSAIFKADQSLIEQRSRNLNSQINTARDEWEPTLVDASARIVDIRTRCQAAVTAGIQAAIASA